ncbi:MAG: hypothetical protein ACQESH_06335 [Campylobacterota bacterium]
MKFLLYISFAFLSAVAFVYILLFTKLGNAALKPLVQKSLQHHLQLDIKVTAFELDMKNISLAIEIDDRNNAWIEAKYNLFNRCIDGFYELHMQDAEHLAHKVPLYIANDLTLVGKIEGEIDYLKLSGEALYQKSKNSYRVFAKDFALQDLKVFIHSMPAAVAFELFNLPNHFNGSVVGEVAYDFKQKRGQMQMDLDDASLQKSILTQIFQNYLQKNIADKPFTDSTLSATFDKKYIDINLMLQLEKMQAKTENLQIVTQTKDINGNLSLLLNNHRYNIDIEGNLSNLGKAFDYEALMKQEIQRQIEKKTKDFIQREASDFILNRLKKL